MKPAAALFILLLPASLLAQQYRGKISHRQTGYAQVAFSVYGNDRYPVVPGVSFGAGALFGNNITTGGGFDIYMFDPGKIRFVQGYADFRAYFAGLNKAGPFLSVQPGVVLVKREPGAKMESGFSATTLGGFFIRMNKRFGLTAAVGYGLLDYAADGHSKGRNGIKFNVGICF